MNIKFVNIPRVALDSIPAKLAALGLAGHAALTLGGAIWAIQHTIANGGHEAAYGFYTAIGVGVITAFGVSTATVITIAEVIDSIMVLAHFISKKMRAEGRAEGRAEAEAAMYARMSEWFNRLLESHPELKDSIEPLPAPDGLDRPEQANRKEDH